jgi:23S rRNA (uracil1939-C5)-methyltransferase
VPLDALTGVSGVTFDDHGVVRTVAGQGLVGDTSVDLLGPGSPVADEVTWRRSAASFFQANRFLVGALVRRVLTAVESRSCVDLYSGVGLFALALAGAGRHVIAVENDPTSAADLSLNAEPWSDRCKVVAAPAEAFLLDRHRERPDTIVLDPPRTGASEDAIAGLAAWRPARIVYVSCDPPTLARDAAALAGAGYSIGKIDAFDLFPNTPHVEAVAVFDRR